MVSAALAAFGLLGALVGAGGTAAYYHRSRTERRYQLGEVLVQRSDSVKRIDELAGALVRGQHAVQVLNENTRIREDPRTLAAQEEVRRLDAELRREVRYFFELNACAERKGAAPAMLRPPDAEALLSAHATLGGHPA